MSFYFLEKSMSDLFGVNLNEQRAIRYTIHCSSKSEAEELIERVGELEEVEYDKHPSGKAPLSFCALKNQDYLPEYGQYMVDLEIYDVDAGIRLIQSLFPDRAIGKWQSRIEPSESASHQIF